MNKVKQNISGISVVKFDKETVKSSLPYSDAELILEFKDRKAMVAEINLLKEALEFYANPNSWAWTKINSEYDQIDPVDRDHVSSFSSEKVGGKLAREVLKKYMENK